MKLPSRERDASSAPAPAEGKQHRGKEGQQHDRHTETAPPGERPAPPANHPPRLPAQSPTTPMPSSRPSATGHGAAARRPPSPAPLRLPRPHSVARPTVPPDVSQQKHSRSPSTRGTEGDGQDLRRFARPLVVKVIYTTNRPPQRLPAYLDTTPTRSPSPGYSPPVSRSLAILLLESLQN